MARQGSSLMTPSSSLHAPRWLQYSDCKCSNMSVKLPNGPMHSNTITSSRPMLLSQPVHVCNVRSNFGENSRIRPQDIPSLRSGQNFNAKLASDSCMKPSERRKMDEQDDSHFYSRPRFVEHTDEDFLHQLRSLYSFPQETFEVSGPLQV